MGTQTTVPNFKLAKVGEKRERRGGGLPWWPHLAAGQKLTVAAVLGCKAGIVGLVAVLLAGAAGTGLMISNEQQAKHASRQRSRALAARSIGAGDGKAQYNAKDLSGVRSDRKNQDSLGFLSGSLDGKTPEERAREQAEAEAKAKAEAEAQAKAEAEAQAKAEADVQAKAAVPGMPDMSALTAAANKPSASPSAAMPPSGNKGFGPMAGLSKSMGDASSKASFDAAQLQKPDLSKAVAMKQPTAARVGGGGGGGAGPKTTGKTFSGRQLRYAGAMSSRGAAAGSGESAARLSNQAFEGLHVVQADNVDSGGIGDGSFKAKSDKDPSGTPMDVPGGGGKSSDPPTDEGESTDPTDKFFQALKWLTIIGGALSALGAIMKLMQASVWTMTIYYAWAILLSAIGAAIIGLSITVGIMGRPIVGGIYGAVGGVMVAAAWLRLVDSINTPMVITNLVAGIVGVMMPLVGQNGSTRKYKGEGDPNDHKNWEGDW